MRIVWLWNENNKFSTPETLLPMYFKTIISFLEIDSPWSPSLFSVWKRAVWTFFKTSLFLFHWIMKIKVSKLFVLGWAISLKTPRLWLPSIYFISLLWNISSGQTDSVNVSNTRQCWFLWNEEDLGLKQKEMQMQKETHCLVIRGQRKQLASQPFLLTRWPPARQ